MDSCESGPYGTNPKTGKPHIASYDARHGEVKPETTSKKEPPEGHVCAPCDHQDAINQIKERYGGTPPHLATTVNGGKDLSM